jgi:XrtJ-associated TM-motif-TM protein
MTRRSGFLLALMLGALVFPLHAQGGCVDSPESPTIVLALVGGIGIVAVSIRASRGQKPQ